MTLVPTLELRCVRGVVSARRCCGVARAIEDHLGAEFPGYRLLADTRVVDQWLFDQREAAAPFFVVPDWRLTPFVVRDADLGDEDGNFYAAVFLVLACAINPRWPVALAEPLHPEDAAVRDFHVRLWGECVNAWCEYAQRQGWLVASEESHLYRPCRWFECGIYRREDAEALATRLLRDEGTWLHDCRQVALHFGDSRLLARLLDPPPVGRRERNAMLKRNATNIGITRAGAWDIQECIRVWKAMEVSGAGDEQLERLIRREWVRIEQDDLVDPPRRARGTKRKRA